MSQYMEVVSKPIISAGNWMGHYLYMAYEYVYDSIASFFMKRYPEDFVKQEDVEDDAATVIQKHVRGHLVRKPQKSSSWWPF